MVVIDGVEDDLRALISRDFPSSAAVEIRNLLRDWLHLAARRIPPRPRNVLVSEEVAALRCAHGAIGAIEADLRSGRPVASRLGSSLRRSPANPCADMMFNDWQISHFHLGLVYRNPGEIARTGPLLFAFINFEHAVLLDVQPHGSWTMRNLLRILRRTFPQAMEVCRLRGVLDLAVHYTDDEIYTLRSSGGNAAFELDGEFFMSPGMGVAGSRHAVRLARLADRILDVREEIADGLRKGTAPPEIMRLIAENIAMPVRLSIAEKRGDEIFSETCEIAC